MGILDWFRRKKRKMKVPPAPATCDIRWQPSVLRPVFYGWRQFPADDAPAPGECRVFYPSLDGAAKDAPLLSGCGRYPLVVFAHGHCPTARPGDEPHYLKWFELPAQLARSGYVVLVPRFPDIEDGDNPSDPASPEPDRLVRLVSWLRDHPDFRSSLVSNSLALVGHSYGALLAAKVASTTSNIKAYVSLAGPWDDWRSGRPPIYSLNIPKLFLHGDLGDPQAYLDDEDWKSIPRPKHRAVFKDGEHFDFLPAGRGTCGFSSGPCRYVPHLTADLVAAFLGKYLPPEIWPNLGKEIPLNLIATLKDLTEDHKRFAGNHLTSWSLIQSTNGKGCSVTLTWDTSDGKGSTKKP